MNLQFVTIVYAMLTHLSSYLWNPEHTVSKLMKKASKEAYAKDIKSKMNSISNIFLNKWVSQHMKQSKEYYLSL